MLLEFTLSFTSSQWVCSNDLVKFHSDSLAGIDIQVEKYIQQKYQKGTFRIQMFFDFERFPKWHRQYMSHYFNRDYIYNLEL